MKVFTYQDFDVRLTDGARFAFDGSENTYESADAVKSAIDNHVKNLASVAKRSLALAIVSSDAKQSTIHGIHSSRRVLLFKPAIKEGRFGSDPNIYPDEPKIVGLIKLRQEKQAELDALDEKLRKVEIEWRGYTHQKETLAISYDAIEKEHAKRLKAAESL
jgi:hypothetical protein